MAVFNLAELSVSKTLATFDVSMTLTSSAGDNVQAFQLGLAGNGTDLVAGGTNFSLFKFTLNTTSLTNWVELVPVQNTGLGLYGPTDPVAGPFISPGTHDLGTLSIITSGLAPGSSHTLTLANGPTGLQTDVGGSVGGVLVPSFDASTSATVGFSPASVTFTIPSNGPSVPLPAAFWPGLVGLVLLFGWVRAKRQTAAN
jgi:hypothetical protein